MQKYAFEKGWKDRKTSTHKRLHDAHSTPCKNFLNFGSVTPVVYFLVIIRGNYKVVMATVLQNLAKKNSYCSTTDVSTLKISNVVIEPIIIKIIVDVALTNLGRRHNVSLINSSNI